ncbi:MAG: lipopolysaccharide kinase InaA family protein [Planctomycetota bacterium]
MTQLQRDIPRPAFDGRVVRTDVDDGLTRVLGEHIASDAFRRESSVLKGGERSAVWRGPSGQLGETLGCEELVVKTMRLDGFKDRVKMITGATRHVRQWRGAETIDRAGLFTVRCFAIVRGTDDRGRTIESLVMARMDAPTLLEQMADDTMTLDHRRALAKAVGRSVGTLAMRGVRHRDHKPSNVLVRWEGDVPLLFHVDTVGVSGRVRGRHEAEAFVRIEEMLFALHVESVGCGVEASVYDRMRATRSAIVATGPSAVVEGARAEMWSRLGARLAAHGDPRPRVDPLG